MIAQNSSLAAGVAERQQELDSIKSRLDETSTSLDKERQLSASRQSEIDELRQRVTNVTTQQQNAEQKLFESQAAILKLQVHILEPRPPSCNYGYTF